MQVKKKIIRHRSRRTYVIAGIAAGAAVLALALGGCKSGTGTGRASGARAPASAEVSAELATPQGKAAKALAVRCLDESTSVRKLEHCLAPTGHLPALKACIAKGFGAAVLSKAKRHAYMTVSLPQCILANR